MAKEHRCGGCGKILLRSDCIDAEVQCQRSNCKTVNHIKYFTDTALLSIRIIDKPKA